MRTQHEGARWRQEDSAEDEPRQQPMQAGLKPAERKAPTQDQKKVRRQMAKSAHISNCPECGGQSAGHDESHWHMHGLSTHYLDKIGNDYVARHRETGQVAKRWTTRADALAGAWKYEGDDWPDPRPQGGYPEEKAKRTASQWMPESQREMQPQPQRTRVKTMDRERTQFQPRTDLDDDDGSFDPYLVKRCVDHGSAVTGDRESQSHYLPVVIADHDHAITHGDREHRAACHSDGGDCWSCCPEMYIAKPGERESGRTAKRRALASVRKEAMDGIERAGDRTCTACGYHGAPRMGDTAPICSRCGSYSLQRSNLRPTPSAEERGENSRYKNRDDYQVTSRKVEAGYWTPLVEPATDKGHSPTYGANGSLECTNCGLTGNHLAEHPCPTHRGEYKGGSRKTATQFERNLARQDGQILIQNGESIRLPNGFTTKVNNVRRHETSGDHYYVDTDMGTSVMPWSTKLTVVPSDTLQQPSPGYADPRGNANQHPGNPSPFQGPNHAQEAFSDKCPVCGGTTMASHGTKAKCTRCGYTESHAGGPSFSDSPQMIKPHSSLTAVARRATEVLDQMKETL